MESCIRPTGLLYILSVLLALLPGLTSQFRILYTFRDPDDLQFQRLALHRASGSVYIGATNRLHRLTANLTLIQSASTGPHDDNPMCPPPNKGLPCQNYTRTPTDSYTKGLVIDETHETVILCTSIFQGFCQIVKARNITDFVGSNPLPVVPNDAESSCAMFVSEGTSRMAPALYIAAEYSSVGTEAYRNIVPSLSKRDVSTLDLAFRDTEGASKITLLPQYRTDFKIRFLSAFEFEGFAYFIFTQPKSLKSKEVVTRVGRICLGDDYFWSYIEVPLRCQDMSADPGSNAVAQATYLHRGRLFVSFSEGDNVTSQKRRPTSSVCVYEMSQLQGVMADAIQDCYNGQGRLGPQHYRDVRSCIRMRAQQPDHCANTELAKAYAYIEGSDPVIKSSSLHLPDVDITSLTAGQEDGHEMLFAGTKSGDLIKILVNKFQMSELLRFPLGVDEPVVSLASSPLPERVFALSQTKAFILDTNHCSTRSTCSECVADGDPVCGWCVMESRCTMEASCPSSVFQPHWLAASKGACVDVSDVKPTQVSYQDLDSSKNDKKLSFQLETVSLTPTNDLDIGCLYKSNSGQHLTPASIQGDRRVMCPLPARDHLPSIPQGKDYEELSVHFHVKGKSIVTRSVSVYNCNVHTSCQECVKSVFGCQWCYKTGTCLEPLGKCPNTGPDEKGITSAGECPHLRMPSSDIGILVHSGESKAIAVGISNLLPGQMSNIKCSFTYSGKSYIVDGSITSSSLSCDGHYFEYKGESPYVAADFIAYWGPNQLPFDNPDNIQVRIYKCQHMVSYCGQCLLIDPEYGCGWCQGNDQEKGQCALKKRCAATRNWLSSSDTCPNPQITRFSPATGPIKGKTVVSVSGINLGKAETDLTATIAGQTCTILADHYQASTRFLCEVGQVDKVMSGNISVEVDGKYTAVSDSEFSFVDPVLKGLKPLEGPVSGGTTVTIMGENLDTGSHTSVFMSGNSCKVISKDKSSIECITPAKSGNSMEVKLEVSFGDYRKEVKERFTYKPDPSVVSIEPKKTILSGGTIITVRGSGFDLIQDPQFFTEYDGKTFKEKCTHDFKLLTCKVPAITAPALNVTDTSPLEVHYGFIMANAVALRNLSREPDLGPLMFYPDPYVEKFEGENRTKKFAEGEPVPIKGRFRMVSTILSSLSVYVGNQKCDVIEANEHSINFLPPTKTPDGTDSQGRAAVTMQLGYMKSVPGYLRYFSPADSEERTSKKIALGIILGVVVPILFIVILLTICVLKRHRKHKPDQNYIPDVLKDYEGKKEGEEEIGMDNMPVKVDMNGGSMDCNSDSTPYINNLLAKFEEPVLRQSLAAAIISRKKLEIGDLVGKGHYGVVYKAVYRHSDPDRQTDVAVKTLQAHRSGAEALQQFLQDVAMVRDLSHNHLLRVVGAVVSASDDPIVVTPFMATEDLGSFVRESSNVLTLCDLLTYCHQISDAMAYLENLRIVHRNLAARNCIITEEEGKQASIKLTDYVVTAGLFPREFFMTEDGQVSELVRWMAPEAVESFAFTSHSDAWSFGIVMWEVLTRGVEPYPDVAPQDILTQVKDGFKLPKPKQCPENVHQLILSCWNLTPEDRPSFMQLMEQLGTLVGGQDGDEGQESQPLTLAIDVGGANDYKTSY